LSTPVGNDLLEPVLQRVSRYTATRLVSKSALTFEITSHRKPTHNYCKG